MFAISPTIEFRKFGYLPRASLKYNLYAANFGHPNLVKRLQARDIMSVLKLDRDDVVLDFGCGGGFFAVEMAKLAKRTVGIDIHESVKSLKVPDVLDEKLEFIQADGRKLPFGDGTFSVVFASEIIGFIPDSDEFMREITRILKPGGRLVICNGCGHPAIQAAYQRNRFSLRLLKALLGVRVPDSYEEYVKELNIRFGNQRSKFIQDDEIEEMVQQHQFRLGDKKWSPNAVFGKYYSWSQFVKFCMTGNPMMSRLFLLPYALFSVINKLPSKPYRCGLILEAIYGGSQNGGR